MEQIVRAVRPLIPLVPLGMVSVFVATALVGLWRSHRSGESFPAYGSALLDVTLTASILSVLILTLPPSIPAPRTINLMPFNELIRAPATVRDNAIAQMLANILLFAPLGFLPPLRWRTLDSYPRVIAVAAAFSTTIEVAQLIVGGGRQTSITDVILNTIGALVGYLLLRIARSAGRALLAATGQRDPGESSRG